MSHYSVLVIYEGLISDAEKKAEEMLEPYGIDAGQAKISKPRSKLEKEYLDVVTNPKGKWSDGYSERARNMGFEEWVKMAYKNSEINSNFDLITRLKRNYKWDWYKIGSRSEGELKLKKNSSDAYPPNAESVDIAYAKDIDLEGLVTGAVLDERGFHEPKDYFDEQELNRWKKNFKKRFLSKLTENTVFVLVDLHT